MIPDTILQVSCDEIVRDEVHGDDRIAKFVADELAHLVPGWASIITFDGFDGVGKSTLARHLAATLKLKFIGLDDFLERHQDCYLDALRIDEFSREVFDSLSDFGKIVVEGCLVETAFEVAGKSPDFRFYVMRTTVMRSVPEFEIAQQHEVLYGDKSAKELIAEKEKQAKGWAEYFGDGDSGDLPELERELIQYHRDRRPHDRSDVIVKMIHRS